MVTAPCERIWRKPLMMLCGDPPRWCATAKLRRSRELLVPLLLAAAGALHDGVERANGGVFERAAETDREPRLGERLVVAVQIGERLREIVVGRGRLGIDNRGPAEKSLRAFEVAFAVGSVASAH